MVDFMCKKKTILFSISLIVVIAIIGIIFIDNIVWKEVSIHLSPDYNELFSEEQMKEKGHISELPEYATDVSIAYQNRDGTKTLYVYSAPIRFLNTSGQYSIIDTRMANVRDTTMRDRGYIYTIANSDIKSFFPKELNKENGIIIKNDIEYEFGICDGNAKGWYREFENFVSNDKNGVHYYNCFNSKNTVTFYPSYLGADCEITFKDDVESNQVDFWLNVDSSMILKEEQGGYITINQIERDKDGKENILVKGVIQKPLLKTDDGNICFNNTLILESEGEGKYKLSFCFDTKVNLKNTTAFIAFELRREKQPDNAIYSKISDLEYAYLRNYSVIGDSKEYGVGRLLIRYKFAKYFNLEPSKIKSAYYNIFSVSKNNEKFELLSVLEDWCSITGNWNDKYKTGDRISSTSGMANILSFDITNEVIKWAEDTSGQMEHNGVLLKQQDELSGKGSVFLSNDNTLYRNFTEVILYN